MDLSAPGVFVFLDNLSGPELSPFARKVERLGYVSSGTRRASAGRASRSARIS